MKEPSEKRKAGSSLIEIVIAIALLGMITVPLMTGLVLSVRLNEKAERLMSDRLLVTSKTEELMAEGVTAPSEETDADGVNVVIEAPGASGVCEVTVRKGEVKIETKIRKK